MGVSLAMNQFRRRSADARRARAEAELLSEAVATVTTSREDLMPLLDTLRSVFDVAMVAVMRLVEGHHVPELVSGDPAATTGEFIDFRINEESVLRLSAVELDNQDRQLIAAFAARLAAALHSQRLMVEAQSMRERAENDALRIGLLRSVAHDLKPALKSIESNVSSLRTTAGAHPSQRDSLASISREVDNLTRLVTNLLDSGRLEAKVITPRHWRVAVGDVVANALGTLDAKGRRIEVELDAQLPTVDTDPDLLERVVVNVLTHAVVFSPVDLSIRVTAGCTPSELELLVVDRGPGTRDQRRRLPSLDSTEVSADEDLGLSVAAGFAKLLGGELRFEDTPGGGLTVVVSIPLSSASATVDAPRD